MEDFTTRCTRGTEFTEGDDFLICRETAANQNHRASGRLVVKATSPVGLGLLSDRNLPIGQDYHFLCVLCVSVVRRIPSCKQLYAPISKSAALWIKGRAYRPLSAKGRGKEVPDQAVSIQQSAVSLICCIYICFADS
jgi:hypothetical protein